MSLAPRKLVFLLDAVVNDDDEAMRSLIRDCPYMAKKYDTLTRDERTTVLPAGSTTNHFYTCGSMFGLVVVAELKVRELAKVCLLNQYIHWGTNSDPVSLATVADVAELLQISKEHETPVKILSFFKSLSTVDEKPKKRARE